MTPRHDTADAALDRALAQARTPQVPADLARRIVADVTRLPQELPRHVPDAPANPAPAPRRRIAGLAVALALAAGVAGTLLLSQRGDDGREGQVIASSAPSSQGTGGGAVPQNPSPALAETRAAAAPDGENRLAVRPATALPHAASELVGDTGVSPAPERNTSPASTPSAPAPSSSKDEGTALAHQEGGGEERAIGPVDDSASSQPVYGPPAPQGLGVAGGSVGLPSVKASPHPDTARPSGGPGPGSGPGPGPGPVGGGTMPRH